MISYYYWPNAPHPLLHTLAYSVAFDKMYVFP